jgi:hypothetical protein
MLIVDGVKYEPWTPQNEEKEFHPLIKANSKEIFGKDIIYFDVKTMIKTASGIGTIPDAYVIKLTEPYEWYVIENELATHSIYDHVVNQLTKFINGIDNKDTRNQILDMLYEVINKDNNLRSLVSTKTGYVDIHHFLSKLFLAKNPRIVVIIDKVTLDLEEACQALRYTPDIIEFKSFVKEDGSKSFAHLFEPLIKIDEPTQAGPTNKKKFLSDLDNNAISVFEAIYAAAERQKLPIHWGAVGFSLNADVEGNHVALIMGYPRSSAYSQTIYTYITSILTKVKDGEQLFNSFKENLAKTGLFKPAGNEMKYVIEEKPTEAQIEALIKAITYFAEQIQMKGLIS